MPTTRLRAFYSSQAQKLKTYFFLRVAFFLAFLRVAFFFVTFLRVAFFLVARFLVAFRRTVLRLADAFLRVLRFFEAGFFAMGRLRVG